ncbi:unnamed protein product [Periconia digitata]|uniref:Uncharacterized protein n=1 Tax=Periconia digitata TaxID=1303443 RepID=A0A9W4XV17_9PLEO|nr:unnamed protein product [Periconia digitata]
MVPSPPVAASSSSSLCLRCCDVCFLCCCTGAKGEPGLERSGGLSARCLCVSCGCVGGGGVGGLLGFAICFCSRWVG